MSHIRKQLQNILNKLHIKKAYDIVMELTDGHNYSYYIDILGENMIGGDSDNNGKCIPFKYRDIDFIFYKYNRKDTIHYAIYQKNDIAENECVLIMINKKEKFANIHEISYDSKCFNKIQIDAFGNNATGSLLLKVTLAFINKIKTHYDLQYIQLNDNSQIFCKKIKKYIDLDSFLMLTSGDTWYGRYGFVPFDTIKKKTNMFNLRKYQENRKIVNDTKLKDTKIMIYVEELMKILKVNNDVITTIKKKVEKYPNVSVRNFLSWFLDKSRQEYTCQVFYGMYQQIMEDLKMHNLHKTCYWKQL